MSLLLLGAGGIQGTAALYDLARSPGVQPIIAADNRPEGIRARLGEWKLRNVDVVKVDANDRGQIGSLMERAEMVVNLLPSSFSLPVARLATEKGVSLVDSGYVVDPSRMSEPATQKTLADLDKAAKRAGVTILRECGFDPGIDLLLCGQAARELDVIREVKTYGSGFPESEAANNPLKYKITWTFDGVLKSYFRGGRYLQDGAVRAFAPEEEFAPGHVHSRIFPPFGELESYPNGDSLALADELGIRDTVASFGRFVSRWPGHAAFWYRLANLGFLGDNPIRVGDVSISPRAFLAALLEPQLHLAPNERDVAFIVVEMKGFRDGKPRRIVYQMIDRRDLATGFLAMQRTVGFTASIGAQLIMSGVIAGKGVISPLRDVPFDRFVQELKHRGIEITRSEE